MPTHAVQCSRGRPADRSTGANSTGALHRMCSPASPPTESVRVSKTHSGFRSLLANGRFALRLLLHPQRWILIGIAAKLRRDLIFHAQDQVVKIPFGGVGGYSG